MPSPFQRVIEPIRSFPFQLKHISVLFVIIIIFQVIVSILHKTSLQKFLLNTQTWYQQDSAERLANLTATSLELLLETRVQGPIMNERDADRLAQGLNIILSQQILNQNVKEVCILIPVSGTMHAIDDGHELYKHMFERRLNVGTLGPSEGRSDALHQGAIGMYKDVERQLRQKEEIVTVIEESKVFHVFVPFVLRGEFVGVMYMKNSPDFSFITRGITSSYDETAITFFALILFGLLAMFYISSHTVQARDEVQRLLFEKEKERLTEHIHHQKELMFTKRIYHTHHKAEKVMGFIKEDLRRITVHNIEEVKHRVTKYSNFVARVIYDMKWYDPPIQTIRSSLFKTDVNHVLRFLVENVFERVSNTSAQTKFELQLDGKVPPVPINEFVVWEAFEPVIQNCIEHGGVPNLAVTIATHYDAVLHKTTVTIADNGVGVPADLLETNEQGVKRILLESVSTKTFSNQHSGYGCYIAHEIAAQRCGWEFDMENAPGGGSRATFIIPHEVEGRGL